MGKPTNLAITRSGTRSTSARHACHHASSLGNQSSVFHGQASGTGLEADRGGSLPGGQAPARLAPGKTKLDLLPCRKIKFASAMHKLREAQDVFAFHTFTRRNPPRGGRNHLASPACLSCLTLAALAVGLLTPVSLLERHYLEEKGKTAEEAGELAEKNVGSRVAEGFGRTSAKIGILIAMAAIIGNCLMESGGALRSCVPSSI